MDLKGCKFSKILRGWKVYELLKVCWWKISVPIVFNSFPTSLPLLYHLKTSENQPFSDVSKGQGTRTLVENRWISGLKSPPEIFPATLFFEDG